MLNSLLGRFALDIYRSVTKLVDKETYEKLRVTIQFINYPKKILDRWLLTYIPEIDKKYVKS